METKLKNAEKQNKQKSLQHIFLQHVTVKYFQIFVKGTYNKLWRDRANFKITWNHPGFAKKKYFTKILYYYSIT